MSRKRTEPLDTLVYIALSEQGWPAPFIGYAYQRKMLTLDYERTFGHSLKKAGYRIIKVRLTEAK